MNKFKQRKGITLIALVITIILMLILAGISIQAITNTGIFAQAESAKKTTENAKIDEIEKLGDYEDKIGQYVDGSNRDGNTEDEEIENLKNRVLSLETKVNTLQSKVLELSSQPGTGLRKTDLFYDKADTLKKEYSLSDDIANYSFLIVYATLGDNDISNRGNIGSLVIDTNDILYNTTYNGEYIVGAQIISGSSLYSYGIRFGFLETTNELGKTEKNKFVVNNIFKGSGYSSYPAYIYKIVGVK